MMKFISLRYQLPDSFYEKGNKFNEIEYRKLEFYAELVTASKHLFYGEP